MEWYNLLTELSEQMEPSLRWSNASQTVTVFADFETAHGDMVSTGGLFEGLDNATANSGSR